MPFENIAPASIVSNTNLASPTISLAQIQAMFGAGDNGFLFMPSIANVFANSDGTGSVADQGRVGYITDLSGKGNHFIQPDTIPNGGTERRPRLWALSGNQTLRFTGSEYIRRPSSLLWGTSGATLMMAINGGLANERRVYSEGGSLSNNAIYDLLLSSPTTGEYDRACSLIRNDALSTLFSNASANGLAGVFDDTMKILTVIDTTTAIQRAIGDAALTSVNYTRSGSFTFDQSAIGVLWRITTGGGFFVGYLSAILGINRQFNSDERTLFRNFLAQEVIM